MKFFRILVWRWGIVIVPILVVNIFVRYDRILAASTADCKTAAVVETKCMLSGAKTEKGKDMIDFSSSQKGDFVSLPDINVGGGVSIEKAIMSRRSIRSYSDRTLSGEDISILLWAAQGITEKSKGLRSAPSAGATYPLELYIATKDYLAMYIPESHGLVLVMKEDLRMPLAKASFGQMWVADAPLIVIFTAVMQRTESVYGKRAEQYVHIEVGCASENLMLQAASMGLGSVAVGAFNDGDVSEILALPEGCNPFLIVPVGHPR